MARIIIGILCGHAVYSSVMCSPDVQDWIIYLNWISFTHWIVQNNISNLESDMNIPSQSGNFTYCTMEEFRIEVQSNLSKTDIEGIEEYVHVKEVSIL